MKTSRRLAIIVSCHIILFFGVYFWNNWETISYYLGQNDIPENVYNAPPKENLTITYRESPTTLEPSDTSLAVKSHISFMYEGLVGFDANLHIIPKLAVSWGKKSDTAWEFQLRPNVSFHDGSMLSAIDIIASFERLKRMNADLLSKFSSISAIRVIDPLKIDITTHFPDPLLLQKLTDFVILPHKKIEEERRKLYDFSVPVGTGPYQFVTWKTGEYLQLKSFADYYEQLPPYPTLFVKSLNNKYARLGSVRDYDTDILADTPTEFVNQIKARFGYSIYAIPKLESTFMLFNFKSPLARHRAFREAVLPGIDYDGMRSILGSYGYRLSQFFPVGVFGYDPDQKLADYDFAVAEKLLSESDFIKTSPVFTLVLNEDNETFGYFLKEQLEKFKIQVQLSVKTNEELLQALQKGEGDGFLLGWQFYDGDAQNMLSSLIHSQNPEQLSDAYGRYNGIFYRNTLVDRFIKEAEQEIIPGKRLEILRDIVNTILHKDIVGIPLFQSYQIYTVSPRIPFTPRVDTLIDI